MCDERADVERGLAWITGRLPSFAPWGVPGGRPPEDRSRLKPLGELAMTATYLGRWHADSALAWPALDTALRRWREFVTACCADERYLALARGDTEHGVYRVQPYAWLRAGGVRMAEAEQVVRDLWRAGCRPTSVGQVHSLAKAGFVRDAPRWDDLFRRWLLRPEWSDAELDREVYRITHAVFYATDFGDRRPDLTDGERSTALAVLSRLAERSRRSRHWDRLVETTIAVRSLGGTPCADDRRQVRGARLASGAVPRDADVGGESFAACYHATLAALLDGVRHEVDRHRAGRAA
ncbi:DUF6895 family protein [Saccharothrix isguenensis]